MPAATTPSASPLPPTVATMEDRKRPAVAHGDDIAPPSKRVAVNGAKGKDDNAEMKEENWIDTYTKGAIYRQMQEYSRKAATAESRLEAAEKKAIHHDDHLRIIDAWWRQVLEELQLLADGKISASSDIASNYLSGTSFKDLPEFQTHLENKGKSIISEAETLLSKLAAGRGTFSPEVSALEGKVNSLLASQKDYMLKLDRLNTEKNSLSEELNVATLRFFKAEKRLDRAKSAQVQKLEQQALSNATRSPAAAAAAAAAAAEPVEEKKEANGEGTEILIKYEEVSAEATKQKEQLSNILSQLKSLQDENSDLKVRRDNWTDEDFVRTDVFKQFKGQNEDLIRRINTLEATNKQLREEAEKLQAERSLFRTQLEEDTAQTVKELEAELTSRDQDLARVRSARDEILAENTQRKASMEQEKASFQQMKDLVAAKDDRIVALESEVARSKPAESDVTISESAAQLSEEQLRQKYTKLEQDFKAINNELPAIEKAYKKMKDLAQKKVLDFAALEEKSALLVAEKSKADQKYFAARKDADTRNNEIRSLRHQNGKSAEIIAQLKDIESHNRVMLSNLEKQLTDLKQTNASLTMENRRMESATQDSGRRTETLSRQITDLTSMVKSKDQATADARERNTSCETELEKLKVRVDHMNKEKENWKNKALSNSSEEEEMLRTFALCTICRNNFKNTALKTCGHLFCNKCIDDRISNRMRKCPSCSRAFDKMDVMPVHH
ncbi:Putative RING-12 protein [[Torrubiella] hemipterigena]|uniref:E3 ubiquitin protein ligase n=2 Tax=[Torrubiella] hemipterigena TaxID=1531966 RepID=A0A0A1SXA8_9HYPO|nr:Putative RING-12 protein [[Torrubiella] hemipterigena]